MFKKNLNSLFLGDDDDLTDGSSTRIRLGELIKLLIQVLDNSPPDFAYLYGQYESLELLFIFIDNFMLLSKQSDLITSYLNHLVGQMNTEYFSETVDFCSLATLQRFHKFVIECDSKIKVNNVNGLSTELIERFSETLNIFYVNVIEFLVFKADEKRVSEVSEIELILSVISDSGLKTSNDGVMFQIRPVYRSLLIRIVYRNYPEMVSFKEF